MLPWGHAAVGYLLYAGWSRWRRGASPHGIAVIALAVGTQFPDLVDKPLSWTFAVLPTGRSLAHSVLTFALLAIVLLVFARGYDRRRRTADQGTTASTGVEIRSPLPASITVTAFVIGYGSHLLADATAGIATGSLDLAYLLYPLLPLGAPEHGYSFLEFFLSLTVTPLLAFEVTLTVVAIGVWFRDDRPGLATLVATAGRIVPWSSGDHDK